MAGISYKILHYFYFVKPFHYFSEQLPLHMGQYLGEGLAA